MDVLTDTKAVTETKPCSVCWEPVTTTVVYIGTRKLNFEVMCDDCEKKHAHSAEQNAIAFAQKRQQEAFERLCPPLYWESESKRLPEAFLRKCENWTCGPQGIGMVGPAGTGKTRCAWILLKKHHFDGRSIFAVTSTSLSVAAAQQWHDDREVKAGAEKTLRKCHSVDILLIDDLGKQKFTDRAELELFDILDHRSSHMLPVIWTANADGRALKAMLSPDRGDPILRRLTEFSTIINQMRDGR
jgi:DNA replication protein DnaC